MSCETGVCGTGGWTGPKPGDPNNNVSLSANVVFGGIKLSWTYPTLNPHAVIHTLVYRSKVNDFNQSMQLSVAAGSIYFDAVDDALPIEYFYWIRLVSINGTIGDIIGPVSTTSVPRKAQTLESLTDSIDNGALAQNLKTSISGITLLNDQIIAEIKQRIEDYTAFMGAFDSLQDGLTKAMTLVSNEIQTREDGDNALINSVNLLVAANAEALSAIQTERTLRISKDDALAQDIKTLVTKIGDSESGIIKQLTTTATLAESTAEDLTTLVSTVGDSSSGLILELDTLSTNYSSTATAVTTLVSTVGDADSGLVKKLTTLSTLTETMAEDVSTLVSTMGNANSGVVQKLNSTATQASAAASAVTTVEATLNGNVATGQVGLTTKVATVDGKVSLLEAEYHAKLEVNGLVGGFGLYNNGQQVEAGFDVDLFWVGRTQANKVKPFIISGDTVYIDKARIRSGDIDTLKLAGNSVMVGQYAEGYSNNVAASGSTVLISRSISLEDGFNSGLIVTATVSCSATENMTAGFQILINGAVVGDQRASLQGGYGYLFPVSGFGYPSFSGFVTVELVAYNPTTLAGSNKPFTIKASTMSIMGGKR